LSPTEKALPAVPIVAVPTANCNALPAATFGVAAGGSDAV
jgi:hypothetical protein